MFVDAFSQHTDNRPALFFPDSHLDVISYADLEMMVHSVKGQLFVAGVRSGHILAIDVQDDLLHAILLLSCARAGIVTVAGHPGQLGDSLAIAGLLSDKLSAESKPSYHPIAVDRSWIGAEARTFNFDGPRPDDLCRIMLTSGSTGSPKGVALTYSMIEERMTSYAHAFGTEFPKFHRVMCSMKLNSSLGFGFLFYSAMRGGLFCSDSSDFEKIHNSIREHNIEALIASPYVLAELISYCESNSRIFPAVELAMTAGSLVSPALGRQITKQIARKLVIFYGTTETGVIASTTSSGQAGDVGRIVEGRQVQIVLNGQSAEPGVVGTLRITTPSGALPFFELSDIATRSPRVSFSPGDLGFLDTNGHLIIRGRSDDLINAGGTKITPELLEQAIAGAPGIKDCAVLSHRDELGIDRIVSFLVLGPFWTQAEFLAYCERNIGRDLLPSKFVVVQQIPRNQNQKIDRRALPGLLI